MVLVGCQIANISGRLKRHLVSLVQDLCHINSYYFPNAVNTKFISTATLKEDMVKICNCLYDCALMLRISLG